MRREKNRPNLPEEESTENTNELEALMPPTTEKWEETFHPLFCELRDFFMSMEWHFNPKEYDGKGKALLMIAVDRDEQMMVREFGDKNEVAFQLARYMTMDPTKSLIGGIALTLLPSEVIADAAKFREAEMKIPFEVLEKGAEEEDREERIRNNVS